MTNLSDIWTSSHCLSKSQLLNYIQQKLDRDEVYLVESHLNDCSLCSDALDGLMEEPVKTTETQLTEIKTDLEKKILEIHPLKKPALTNTGAKETPPHALTVKPQNRYRWVAAASIMLAIGLGGYSIYSFIKSQDQQLAQEKTPVETTDAGYQKTSDPNANEISSLKISPPEQPVVSPTPSSNTNTDTRFKSVPTSPVTVAANEKEHTEDISASPPAPAIAYTKLPESKKSIADDASIAKAESLEPAEGMSNYMDEKKAIQPQKEVLAKKKSYGGLSNSKPATSGNLRSNQLSYPAQPANMNNQESDLEEIATKDVSSNVNNYETAMQYYNAGEYKKSISYFEKALKNAEGTQKEDIQFQLAEAYLKAGMNRKAERMFERLANSTKYKSQANEKLRVMTK